MSNHKLGLFVVVGLLVGATVLGTSGTTQIEGTRDIEIQIADGGVQPYIGVEVHSPRLVGGDHKTVPLVSLRHTHVQDTALRITATITAAETVQSSPNVTADPQARVVHPGEETTLSAPVRCAAQEQHSRTFTVKITIRGTNVTMELTERITITCTAPSDGSQTDSTTTPASATP